MATQNNVHIPEDLFDQALRMAESQGRSADDLADRPAPQRTARQVMGKLR